MARREAAREATSWLERLGLADSAKKKVNTLSKGNQQKVQFAGAVLHRPVLAVLDEPFAGLDPLNQELVSTLIRDLRDQGSAVLISAHHLDLAERLCDRFLLLSRGRAALTGTLAEIRRAAARGASDVLELDLRCESAQGERVAGAFRLHLRGGEVRLTNRGPEQVRLECRLTEGEDLAPLLRLVDDGVPIDRVSTRSLSLHEIYVRAIGDGGGSHG
jgi:ABC-2 type transport system ATP-binding protein